ncbi:endonuclease/exonuclease/phosphatase family protein [Luteolibacter flavescens]|uniref:Endonuclease/exonuclease/phosphatase family protein n=1 Tax=Luteolibacter flavescens TaxID=1859460 RepID=A0ABT3FKD8_9BACT|nr:endonuclease/exonuclease/phosphatase family protein [Luteolibacter flavescens]MCW1884025.1 endonuclease/exonuclease/phosphatase family protein [Luteolibacter flavescens]
MTLKALATAAAGLLAIGIAEAKPLRVLSYNLRYITPGDKGERAWTARRDQAAELIKKDESDIVGLQEGLPQMMNDLADRLPGYAVIGVGREDGIDRGEYAAILVKADRFRVQESGTFWLSDTPEVVASCTWGNTVTRICTWAKLYDRETKKTFHFFNTHLDHASPEAREKGTALILSRIAPRRAAGPVIITGDFNAAEADPLHKAIRDAGFADIWKTVNPDTPASEAGTFNEFTGVKDSARIDYIYATPDLKGTESEIIRSSKNGVYPSDHFPVRATLGM